MRKKDSRECSFFQTRWTGIVMQPGASVIGGGGEILVGGFGGFGGGDGRRDQDAVAECSLGTGGQRKIHLLFALAENFLAERIGCEKTIAAGVPIGGKAGIGRVIENGDGHGLVANETAEIAPAATRAPGGVALFAFAGEVDAVDAGVVQLGDRSGAAAGVGVNLGFVRRNFKSANDAEAQDAVFLVLEINFFVESAQGGDAVYAAEAGPAAKDEVSMFLEQNCFVESDPIGFDVEFALLRTAFRGDDGLVDDGAHLWSIFRFDGVGIVPEIDAVDAFIIEPKAGVMRVIDAFAGALLERKAASDDGALGGTQRIQNGFFERGGPDVGSERLSIDGDVDATVLFVDGDSDAVAGMRVGEDQ